MSNDSLKGDMGFLSKRAFPLKRKLWLEIRINERSLNFNLKLGSDTLKCQAGTVTDSKSARLASPRICQRDEG